MATFVELTYTGNTPSKVLVNLDNVSTIQGFNSYTQITFNFSITGPNGGFVHLISVVETPGQIRAMLAQ